MLLFLPLDLSNQDHQADHVTLVDPVQVIELGKIWTIQLHTFPPGAPGVPGTPVLPYNNKKHNKSDV